MFLPKRLLPKRPEFFLSGGSFSPQPLSNQKLSLNGRFRLLEQIQKDFWEAWMRDYLTTLQVRKKWFKNGPQIAGDLVLLAKHNIPPLSWKTGRVFDAYTGNDDIARVVKVKTATGEMLRPVVKLMKLPIDH